ncbi:tail fiber protein [Xanthomonas phage RiverRider]|uniref:Tail fiber protein n=1 Tax=Xanthomonas phage RiverRider TaxID=2108116 RepID=A0A2P1JUZ6_9CAUD|nr:tail fiber protein [Xanthomonas phage RiverRider]AVO23166.1 tail fiber protein [Xanthomonas phage RiverRider]
MNMQDNSAGVLEIHQEYSGHYKMEVIRAATGKREDLTDWQDNLITDYALEAIGGIPNEGIDLQYLSSWLRAVGVGTSAVPPAVTDVTFGAFNAETATTNSTARGFTTVAPFYAWYRSEFQFSPAAAEVNLAELGLFNNQIQTRKLITHALIKDAQGNPTTVTLLTGDILVLTYEIRCYARTTDVVKTQTIKGVEQTFTIRPSMLGTSEAGEASATILWSSYPWGGYWYLNGQGVGPSTGKPSGAESMYTSYQLVTQAYTPNSKYRDVVVRLGINDAIDATITGFRSLSAAVQYQLGITPGVPKTADEIVNLTLRMSWGRYTP